MGLKLAEKTSFEESMKRKWEGEAGFTAVSPWSRREMGGESKRKSPHQAGHRRLQVS